MYSYKFPLRGYIPLSCVKCVLYLLGRCNCIYMLFYSDRT